MIPNHIHVDLTWNIFYNYILIKKIPTTNPYICFNCSLICSLVLSHSARARFLFIEGQSGVEGEKGTFLFESNNGHLSALVSSISLPSLVLPSRPPSVWMPSSGSSERETAFCMGRQIDSDKSGENLSSCSFIPFAPSPALTTEGFALPSIASSE